jgi:hypothetical protein
MSAATIDNLRITPRAMRAIDDAAARRAALAADAYDELLAEFFAAVEAGDASAEIRLKACPNWPPYTVTAVKGGEVHFERGGTRGYAPVGGVVRA